MIKFIDTYICVYEYLYTIYSYDIEMKLVMRELDWNILYMKEYMDEMYTFGKKMWCDELRERKISEEKKYDEKIF